MAFIQNQWYAAVWAKDLGDEPQGLRIIGKPIVLFRTVDGGISVLDDLCPHRFVPLHLGKVVGGDRIQCAYHGLEFNGSGTCVHNPHTSGRIPPAAKVKAYTAEQRHGMVWVWLGTEKADPGLIPDLSPLDCDGRPPASGPHYVPTGSQFSLAMKASYQLIGDNLLDLSHACVLHDTLLGNLDMADAEISVEETAHGFIVRRLTTDTRLPGLFRLMSDNKIERGDVWTDMELIGTTCFANHIGVSPSGNGRSGGTGLLGVNILTPIDERTTMYHVDGVLIDPPQRSPDAHARVGRQMGEMANYAFNEQDKVTLEAQQIAIDDPSRDTSRPAMFDVDTGSSHYTRRIKTLLDAESVSCGISDRQLA